MASCEKCWADAGWEAMARGCDKVDAYRRLVAERECTPEEQAGAGATECKACGRQTVHQHAGICMACGHV